MKIPVKCFGGPLDGLTVEADLMAVEDQPRDDMGLRPVAPDGYLLAASLTTRTRELAWFFALETMPHNDIIAISRHL